MAGMYPDNENLELYGETVLWPGVDENGKFTNGDFSNPAKPPSYISAQTINLILDNLSELIFALGKTPDNQSPNQLASAVTAAINAEAQERTAADQNLHTAILAISPEFENNVQAVLGILEEIRSLINTHKTAAALDHPDGSVTAAKLAGNAVETAKIADANVTAAKMSASTTPANALKITTGIDFNTLTAPGFYFCDASAVAAAMSHKPSYNGVAFALVVLKSAGVEQIVYEYNNGCSYRRHYYNNAWSAWVQDPTRAEVDAQVTTAKIADGNVTTAKIADANVTAAKLAGNAVETAKIKDANVTAAKMAASTTPANPASLISGTDLNAVTTSGFYFCGANSTAAAITNKPSGLNSAFSLAVLPIQNNANGFLQIYYSHGSHGQLWLRQRIDGYFSAWTGITDTAKAPLASPVFSGTPKIGDNPVAVAANASARDELNLPIGAYIICQTGGAQRNAAVAPRINVLEEGRYTISNIAGSGSTLSGTWRSCGDCTSNFVLLRRVA